MKALTYEEKLKEIFRLVQLYSISGYEIAKNTDLNEGGVGRILLKKSKKPHKHTIDAIYNYVISYRNNNIEEPAIAYAGIELSGKETMIQHHLTAINKVNALIALLESSEDTIETLRKLKEAIEIKASLNKELNFLNSIP